MTPRASFQLGALGLLGVGLCLALAVLVSCNPFANAARATLGARHAGDEIDRAFARAADAKTAECLKAHGSKTPGYATCAAPLRADLEKWRTIARPAIDAALASSYRGIQLAKIAGAEASTVQGVVTACVCLVAETALTFRHWFPKDAAFLKNILTIAAGFSCPR